MMRRMVDPGLPITPVLYFDAERCEAYVSTRVSDWRAVERSFQLTRVVLVLCHGVCLYWMWSAIPTGNGVSGGDFIAWCVLSLFAYMILMAITSPLIRYLVPRCLSGTFLSRRLTFLFTHDAIGFRSWFYSNGVRITRSFREMPVLVKVAMRADPEAEDYSEYISIATPGKTPRMWPKSHLRQARKLELVISSGSGNTPNMRTTGPRRLRTLPVATLPVSHGEALTVVLNAAIALTQSGTETGPLSSGTIAKDLDRPLPSGG
ncbi:hypothetical protein [Novipirellula rosea]|uniref:Uncharacterized protein n=1 Tax=Novipirellula rosea TaxID=1031540 RepID=A0ABP8NDL7_9BACT